MRPLHQVIAGETTLAGLLDRYRRELALIKRVRQTLPIALAPRVSISDASGSELVLAVASGAAAALVRQRVPVMLVALAEEGWKFTGIRLRVQVRSTAKQPRNIAPNQIDAASAAALERLAAQLDDPLLADALRRLARRARPRSDGNNDQSLEGEEDQQA